VANLVPACLKACGGWTEARLLEFPNLLFADDVLRTTGGVLVSSLLAGMLGIPYLFYRITMQNRTFVRKINVWGGAVLDKWNALVYRLETTGIFLFAIYKYHIYWWSILLFVFKFVLMLVTTIAGRIWPQIIVVLPAVYLAMVGACLKFRPYLFMANNTLNVLLYACNFLFSFVPVCAFYNVELPQAYYLPLAIALAAIPVISLLVLLFCKHSVFDADDPTIDPNAKEKIGVKERRKSEVKLTRETKDDSDGLDLPDIPAGVGGTKRGERAPRLTRQQSENALRGLLPGATYDPNTPGIDRPVPAGFMESIQEFEHVERKPTERCHVGPFTIGENKIRSIATQMYAVLDIVIDGMTIDSLATALYAAMMLGSLGFGWYIGGVRALSDVRLADNFVCRVL
jgi:hypothetical protein